MNSKSKDCEVFSEDEVYFRQIYDRMYRSLYYYVLAHCERGCDVEDILQETFQEAHIHIRQMRDSVNPEGYLMNILKFKILKWKDRQKKEWKENAALQKLAFNRIPEDRKEIWDFCRCYLKEKDYRIIRCRYCEGMPIADIAAEMGISEGACKMRIKRSLVKLKKVMQ